MNILADSRIKKAGFTLIEILVVVLILAILAAIVVPQFTDAADEANLNSLKMNLHRIRQQIELYRQEHNGQYPALDKFEDQMTLSSNRFGQTAPRGTAGYDLGPYLVSVPVNPFTSGNSVGNGEIGESDWYYDSTTGHFRANSSADHAKY